MEKKILTQVQKAQRVPYWINPRRNMPRHTLIRLTKTKDKERAVREKQQVAYEGNPRHLTADLSAETLQARMAGYIQSTEREKSTIKIIVPNKDLIQN